MIDNYTNYQPLTKADLDADTDFQELYQDRTFVVNELSPKNRAKILDLFARYEAPTDPAV